MVMRAAKLVVFITLTSCLLAAAAAAAAPSLPDYRIGEIATEDVVTPLPLTVVDPQATDTLRQETAQRLPIIYRFDPQAADDAELALHNAIRTTRESFLNLVQKTFGTRQIDERALATPGFQELATAFQFSNTSFPASTNLLALWARAEPDNVILTPLSGRLRDAMSRYIRAESLPVGLHPSFRARVVNAASGKTLSLADVERHHDDVSRGNIPTLARIRADLIASFPANEGLTARFLADLLRVNCVPDAELTRQYRIKQTEAIVSTETYEAGQPIIEKGQIVDTKARAALRQLADLLQPTKLPSQLARTRFPSRFFRTYGPWLLGGLVVVLATVLLTVRKSNGKDQKKETTDTPANLPLQILGAESDGMVISCPTCQEHIVVPFGDSESSGLVKGCQHLTAEQWKDRALAAERRAEQAAAMVRAGMLSKISQYLTEDFVKKLIGQRNHLVNEQTVAAKELEQLAERLAKTDGDWKNLRLVYEQRIAELEKELSQSNEINRALIKTKIALARRQLASAEAEHKHTRWN